MFIMLLLSPQLLQHEPVFPLQVIDCPLVVEIEKKTLNFVVQD